MTYIVFFAVPETSQLGIGAGLMLLVTGGIALTIPVQSGFGTYHGMVAGMLILYGIDKNNGFVFCYTFTYLTDCVNCYIRDCCTKIICFGKKETDQAD